MNTRGFRTTDALVCLPAQPETGSPTTGLADERPSPSPVWIDLTALDHAACTMLQEQYGLSPEVMTYFLLRYQSAKLIHAGPALFLVTFLAAPSTRYLFTTRELKICVTPTLVVTLCGASGKAQSDLRRTLPLPNFSEGKVGQLLWGLLAGVVDSYDALVKTVRAQSCEPVFGEEQQQWRRRVTKLVHCLRDEQALLSNVARKGGKVFTPEESLRFRQLEERVGVLARILEEIVQMSQNVRGSVEPELRVILTEREKHTALISGHFSFRRFTAVDLSHAVFHEADLQGAKFVKASLRGAVFHQANLQGAVFSFCDLQEADFTDAHVKGADFHTSYGLSLAMRRYIRSRGGMVDEGGDRERSSSRED